MTIIWIAIVDVDVHKAKKKINLWGKNRLFVLSFKASKIVVSMNRQVSIFKIINR